jgi:serine/threonine-protein kinase
MPGPVDPVQTLAVNAGDERTAINERLPAASGADSASEPQVGSKVGPWALIRLLGHGGMGAVFLAERTEHDFQQRAALKLIKLGMDSNEILQRFLIERRILARLEHPNIARLIDGGVDQRGRPYFVMEWVDGKPLTEYANSHGLDVAARVQLFLKLCDAVAHAHRQLVVHRDLKPGNILIDTRGEPKLLDFGIAKVLENDPSEDTSATGARFFTRAYAAPEQIRGEPVSTATDIYALGAVLFELLTGTPLQRARSGISHTREMLAQARRMAGHDGPAAVSPRMLDGDIALVAAKAVREEPARRYASVEAFAEDLRACLGGRPVRARPDTASYRLTRFLRRHWIGASASAAVLLALVAGAGLALWQARIAQEEALRAEAVSAFMTRVFESAKPENAAGAEITAQSLLETASQRIERELAAQPAVRARLYATLGQAWFYIGDYARAVELHESGRALVAADDRATQVALLRGLAQAELATGQVKLARTHVDQALALLDHDGPATALERTRTLSVSKSVFGAEGDTASALRIARDVHARLLQLLGADSEEALEARNDLGNWTLESGDAAAALEIFDQVILDRRRVSGPEHPEVATAMHNRVLALGQLGRTQEALAEARTVVALRRRILPPLHRDVARSLGTQATFESSLGNPQAALALRDEGIRILRAQRRPDQLLLAQELTNQATDAFRVGDLPRAANDLTEALDRLQPLLGANDARVLAASSYLGLVETYAGKLADAEQRLRAVIGQESASPQPGLALRLATRRYLARAIRWQGRAEEALEVLSEAERWLRDATAAPQARRPPGAGQTQLAASARSRVHVETALTQLALGQLDPARSALERAESAHQATPAATIDRAQWLMARARRALAQQDWAAAQQLAGDALARLRADFEDTHWEVAEARALLALAAWQQRPGPAERAALVAALDWHQRERPWHPDTGWLREVLGNGGRQ